MPLQGFNSSFECVSIWLVGNESTKTRHTLNKCQQVRYQ